MKKQPNILILFSDQHSARTLGCYGNEEVLTPNLDRLASEGITMDNAYCNNPICTPSRMSLLSGQYVHNFGYYGLMGETPEDLPNLFGHCRRAGYTTGAIGKIHTPAGWVSQACDFVADGYGFEQPVTMENRHLEEGCQGLKNDDYAKYLEDLGLYEDRDDKILQEWFEKYGHSDGQCIDARPSRLPAEHSFESWCAQKAEEFLTGAEKGDKPFCLWVSMPRPHETYAAAKEYWDLYEGKTLHLAPNSEDIMADRSVAAQTRLNFYRNDKRWIAFEPDDYESARLRVLRGYYACVTQMDAAVGQVLKALEEMNLADDTIVLYMTDHGEFAGEHGMIEKAPGIGFRCVTRIPMIWRYQGAAANVRRRSIVEGVDVLPTLCQLAGLPAPNWVDGVSMAPVLQADTPIKDYAVTENAHTKTIQGTRYKLTQYLPEFHEGKDFGELYDVEADPWELKNLYFEPAFEAVKAELQRQLYFWLVRTTRVKTVNIKIPLDEYSGDVSGGITWDLAKAYGIPGEDGKVGRAFCENLLANHHKYYI